jgi:hypothetical protein
MEMTEEMLPEREWPGLAVTVLDVSVDTSDSGLGMNSRVSENPTLFRAKALGVCSSSMVGGDGSLSAIATGSGTGTVTGFATSVGFSGTRAF